MALVTDGLMPMLLWNGWRDMVVSLKISHVHHAALCEILRLALDNAMRHGRVNSFDAECTLVRASQRDCGYLRAVIEEHLPA